MTPIETGAGERRACYGFAIAIAIAIGIAWLLPGGAFAQADFTDFVCFGDSLTHNDPLPALEGKPAALYSADPMEAVFDKGGAGGDILTRYAIAGSQSGDIADQIGFYEFFVGIGLQEDATLVSLEAGANDMLDSFALLATHAPGSSAAADAIITSILQNLKDAFIRMRQNVPGVRFIVWTVPDLTLTPRYFGQLTQTQIDNVRAHLDRINRKIRRGENRPSIVVLDVDELLSSIIDDPPVLRGRPLVPPPAMGAFDNLFADEIHPTAVSNAMIANETVMRINAKWNDSIPLYAEDELADLAQIP